MSLCFELDDINQTASNGCDVFISTVDDYIPKCTIKSSKRHAWIDDEVLSLIKKKNAVRTKAVKTGLVADWQKFKDLRRSVKQHAKENRLCT